MMKCLRGVQIVFNVVASVKFNEKLRDAVEINVNGTKKVLDLAMRMQHLKVHLNCLQTQCHTKLQVVFSYRVILY